MTDIAKLTYLPFWLDRFLAPRGWMVLGLTASDGDSELRPRRSIDLMGPTRTQYSVTMNNNGPSVWSMHPDPSHQSSASCT